MAKTQNYTLVTGASTGIGRAIAEELIQNDHIVFAGARKKQDLESLQSMGPKVIPIELDVTNLEQIAKALQQIKSELKGDFCFHLVNNAGIVAPGPIEALKLEALREQLEVNVISVVGVTQAFLPLLKKSKGRIVMISSISGLVSTPFLGAYSASKFALEAISDSLRLELAPFGVKVLIIQPGPITTPIWEKNFAKEQKMLSDLPADVLRSYEKSLAKFTKTTKSEVKKAIPAQAVAIAAVSCLNDRNPPLRQIIAAPAVKLAIRIAKCLPVSLMDKQLTKAYIAQ